FRFGDLDCFRFAADRPDNSQDPFQDSFEKAFFCRTRPRAAAKDYLPVSAICFRNKVSFVASEVVHPPAGKRISPSWVGSAHPVPVDSAAQPLSKVDDRLISD